MDQQILEMIYHFYENVKLGWRDGNQKAKLLANAQKIKNALSFIRKHWSVLFRAEFPHIPASFDEFVPSKLLTKLAETTCSSKRVKQ